jgi:hypothetical protein
VELETPSPAADTLPCVRSLQLQDRAVMDKAQRAFVSYIQAYAKHECNVILRLKGKILCFLHQIKLLYRYTVVVCFITTCYDFLNIQWVTFVLLLYSYKCGVICRNT